MSSLGSRHGRQWDERLRCGLSPFLERPKSFCLPGSKQGQGTGAHWLTSRNTTNPSLALSQEDRETDDDRERDKDAGSNQKFGEPQDMVCFVDPHASLQKHPAPLGTLPGRIRSLASLQLAPPLLRGLGGLPQVSWQEKT